MGITTAFRTTPYLGWFFLSAPSALYLPSFGDQDDKTKAQSAVEPHPLTLRISIAIHWFHMRRRTLANPVDPSEVAEAWEIKGSIWRSESLPTEGISIVSLFEDRSFQTGNTFNHIHHHLTCPLVDHVDPVHKIPISGWSSCSFDADGSDPVAPVHSPCWGHFTDKWWRRWKHSTDSKQSACN